LRLSARSGGLAAILLTLILRGQTPPTATPSAPGQVNLQTAPAPNPLDDKAAAKQSESEVETRSSTVTFQTRVNLVTVQVVVRDASGKVVSNLKKNDFHLFDRGKPQLISKFVVQRPGSLLDSAPVEAKPDPFAPPASVDKPKPTVPIANHFTLYLFDDLHLKFGDLAQVRAAAVKHFEETMRETDRVGIFTTSGQTTLDFTDDRDQIRSTLNLITPVSSPGPAAEDCPRITYYQADLIINKSDAQALQVAAEDTVICMNLSGPGAQTTAQGLAQAAASRMISTGEHSSRLALVTLKAMIKRLSVMPGERSIVLASPGFLVLDTTHSEVTEAIEQATRAKVIINALDTRGLYISGSPDASARVINIDGQAMALKSMYERTSATLEGDILGELADGTSGAWFHDNNDYKAGFLKVAATPEIIYILGFSPENLKLDGSYHKLKVSLASPKGFALQARRGYYAPKQLADPAEQSREEVKEAVFSRDQLSDVPLVITSRFFKISDSEAKLDVLARVDIRHLPYRHEADRNCDNVTIVAALFDRNGNYVTAQSKLLEIRMKDATLQTRVPGGIVVRNEFRVPPGGYVIRVVVRDEQGKLMAADNGGVEIPQ
jgi:VWFA-related protein